MGVLPSVCSINMMLFCWASTHHIISIAGHAVSFYAFGNFTFSFSHLTYFVKMPSETCYVSRARRITYIIRPSVLNSSRGSHTISWTVIKAARCVYFPALRNCVHSRQYHLPLGLFSVVKPTHSKWNHSMAQSSLSHAIISPKETRWQ